MPALSSYDYAIIRVVPRVERGECLNVGIILFCRTRRFLAARIQLDPTRLAAFAPELEQELIMIHLARIPLLCVGGKESGPIGQLSQSERFHWLVSPRSTVIQTSPVHSGLCSDPAVALQRLLDQLVPK